MTDKKDNNTSPNKASESEADFERLDKNERLAFEKIMGEIENSDKSIPSSDNKQGKHENDKEPPKADSEKTVENLSEELDDEQQAALDKIMNEINGDAPDETPADAPEKTDPESASDELDDEQQAALDKIMNEINAGSDENDPSDSQDIQDGNNNDQVCQEEIDEKNTLSLEEFNDELTNLLSDAAAKKEESEISTSNLKAISEKPGESSHIEVEPAHKLSTEALNDQDKKTDKIEPPTKAHDPEDYAILHEVSETKKNNKKKSSKRASKKVRNRKSSNHKKLYQYTVAVLLLVGICGTAYWRFGLSNKDSKQTPLLLETSASGLMPTSQNDSAKPMDAQPQARIMPPSKAMQQTLMSPIAPDSQSLNSLMNDLTSTRRHVLNKISEIKELKAYYQNGILEEYGKMKLATAASDISSFKTALRDKPTELSLRAIQRREVYISKLGAPMKQLSSASEELLFLERKTRIFDTLNQGISDLAIPEFRKEVSEIIDKHLSNSNELSIEHIKINAPSLESIWGNFKSHTAKKTNKPKKPYNEKDKKINQEICNGIYDRKFIVTQLTPESAKCIAQWSGKDLYLNGLITLPPSVAKTIAQWPGEWLSLNGLKELSPESAKHLSQWKGKRMSLNGLTRLNKKTTAILSKWKGEQLEMVGLKSIGRWENYGTRLYLSENLRKKLQLQ
jgi:hypothetical protein